MNILRLLTYVFVLSLIGLTILVPQLSGADPLDNWHVRNSPTTNTLRAVTYGNGLFVAVGDNGTILTSSDGLNWTVRSSGTAARLRSITYGNGVFVTVGYEDVAGYFNSSVILTSTDGVAWAAGNPPFVKYSAVTYGNGVFVAVEGPNEEYVYGTGLPSSIIVSPDAENWTMTLTLATPLYGVAFGNNTFVAVGGGFSAFSVGYPSPLATSPDGLNWEPIGSGLTPRSAIIYEEVAYGGGIFVAVGLTDESFQSRILTSHDGAHWTFTDSANTTRLSGIAYGNDTFVIGGSNGTILTSPDAMNWSARGSGTQLGLTGLTYGNGTFIAVGESGTILQSDLMSGDCTATLSPDLTLHVPVIAFDGVSVYADLQYEPGSPTDIMLTVTNGGLVPSTNGYSNCPASVLSLDATTNAYELYLPLVSFNGASYWARFRYTPTGDGHIWFRLTETGPY